jgi:hypothetical protein
MGNVAKNRTIYVKDIIYQTSAIGGVRFGKKHMWLLLTPTGSLPFMLVPVPRRVVSIYRISGRSIGAMALFSLIIRLLLRLLFPPHGGYRRIIMLISEQHRLLSVPYALYAGNASVTNVNTSLQPGPPNTFLITDSLGNVNWQTPQAAQQTVTTITNFNLNLRVRRCGVSVDSSPNTTAIVE